MSQHTHWNYMDEAMCPECLAKPMSESAQPQGVARLVRHVRVCLDCEGTGIVRQYRNRAGDYTKAHCTVCGGTGKEALREVQP